MAWLAVDKDGTECIYSDKPKRFKGVWETSYYEDGDPMQGMVLLPKGSIWKLIGKHLSWEDESVEI